MTPTDVALPMHTAAGMALSAVRRASPCRGLASAVLLASLAAIHSVSTAEPLHTRTPPGKKFVYKHSRGQAQELEVYFPDNWDPSKNRAPGVLLFHGGGWSVGSLVQLRYACHYFAKRGLVAATANYYMHKREAQKDLPQGESRKRVCITDAKSAIRWMKQHAEELGVDPERIITGGGSAGGHVSVLATINPGLDDPNDPKSINTNVVAYLLWGPAFAHPGRDKDDEVDVFAQLKPGIAPSIFFFGERDNWKRASDALVKKLKGQGATTSVWVAEDEGHNFWTEQPWYDLTLAEADRFLVSLGLVRGKSPLKSDAAGQRLIRER